IMNAGPAIYFSASQKFGTNAQNTLVLQKSAQAANMTLQTFVFRNDGGSGSTIGPLISSLTGIQTVDMGTGQLSMHSAREMSGTIDVQRVKALFASFFKNHPKISQQLDFDN
ncbi:peptidase M18, aminopeptidase I, partial [Conidiobolus coronatus NRRL 28638]